MADKLIKDLGAAASVSGTDLVVVADPTTGIASKTTVSSLLKILPNVQTASYTLVLADAGKDVRMNVATANNLTVPPNSSVAYDIGNQIIVTSIGVGQTTIVAGSGVTINYPAGASLRLRTQFSKAVLEKTGTDTWDLTGDLESETGLIVHLGSDATANSTATLASITGLERTLGPGTYNIQAWVRYQAAATTTGVKFAIDHTGTVTMFVAQMRFASTGTTASTGAATQTAAGATGNTHESFSTRTKGAAMGPTVSVDAAASDMLAIIECMMTVTVSGTLKLMHASEVAAASTVKAGSNFIITKVN